MVWEYVPTQIYPQIRQADFHIITTLIIARNCMDTQLHYLIEEQYQKQLAVLPTGNAFYISGYNNDTVGPLQLMRICILIERSAHTSSED